MRDSILRLQPCFLLIDEFLLGLGPLCLLLRHRDVPPAVPAGAHLRGPAMLVLQLLLLVVITISVHYYHYYHS